MAATSALHSNSGNSNLLEETEETLNLLTLNDISKENNTHENCNHDTNDIASPSEEVDGKSEGKVTDTDGKSEGEVNALDPSQKIIMVSTSASDHAYNMNHKRRGYCLIFNQHRFDKSTELGERSGTVEDGRRVRFLFTKLGFEVCYFEDFTVNEIQKNLEHYQYRVDHSDCDCFAVVFMSHGEDGVLYGKDNMFKSEKLYSYFTPDNCPTLAGKPKMFFIQACRGVGLDSGVAVLNRRSYDETDNGGWSMYKIPIHADFLLCWSTVPGHYSWRNTTNGSWFIQSLVEVFGKQSQYKDVLTMMTNVNRHMILQFESRCPSQSSMHGKKQTACVVSTLMREVYLKPKK